MIAVSRSAIPGEAESDPSGDRVPFMRPDPPMRATPDVVGGGFDFGILYLPMEPTSNFVWEHRCCCPVNWDAGTGTDDRRDIG
jgi:hypothetical protein